ncbi:MAG: alpha/beta hydrolase [Antricoccus sp.]
MTKVSQWTTPDGQQLAYRELGDRRDPAIVLVHGLFSSSRSWDQIGPELAAGGRWVIMPDLRGHGESAKAASYRFSDLAADLGSLLDHLELSVVDLVGHSLGGQVVSQIAQQQPDRVRTLVLEDAPPPPVLGDRYKGPGLRELPVRSRVMLVTFLALRYRWVKRHVDINMAKSILAEFRRPDPQWWTDLAKIAAPTLILHGGPESHVPGRRLSDMTALIVRSEMVTLPVGHRVHNHAPEAYLRHVCALLDSASSPPDAAGTATAITQS